MTSTTTSHPAILDHLRDLGVAWMNRGHALMIQGDETSLLAALSAYGEAVTVLRQLLPAGNPSWKNSLGAALMNHGQLLHRIHGTARAADALASFAEAAAVLRPLSENGFLPANPWHRRNLAGTLLNRASLLLDLTQFSDAADYAREAIALTESEQYEEPVDAELMLKSRRCLCDAIGHLIVEPGADQNALAAEASDLIDQSLALIRHWTARNHTAFAPLALRFFHYGAQLYRLHQPHFLAEFIRENLPLAEQDFRPIALEAVDAALADRPRDLEFLIIGDPASERSLATWRELNALRTRLVA